ncbi:Capsular synthesis regulator component B [Serratia fonticola]|uniref:LuxR C-terminal-related transcriptional regulator n=1 Tax=Serratia fonticola TaxID=47917 RepID=UPI00218295A8|nr:LuxR C-terminal-related transcriptional regulator [Serratia fonticola]CAI2142514.1 Capsular synthesis regulator component B [Serratia fonticola]
MNDQTATINLAIVARSPLIRLGIVQFIQDLQLGYRSDLIASSLLSLYEKADRAAIKMLVVELSGSPEEMAKTIRHLQILVEQSPRLKIVVYSACRELAILAPLQSQNQFSLIAQQENSAQIRRDMVVALAGGRVCSPSIRHYFERTNLQEKSGAKVLTNTERKVMSHLFAGLSMADIAALYHRSIKTISAHKCNSMRKLGVDNDADLFQRLHRDITLANNALTD